jgi:exosortase A
MSMAAKLEKPPTLVLFSLFGLGIALALIFFFEQWRAMALLWWGNETYSHGLLIVPICLWLAWRDRASLGTLKPQASMLGFVPLIAGLFGWLVGTLADVNVVEQFGALLATLSLVPLILGLQFSQRLWFPLLFAFFMVPAGEFLVPPLMAYTADATVIALHWTGIPVYRENMHFTLPTGRWSVVEACSGLRYVIAAVVLACLFSYLNYKTWAKRILFTLACLVMAVVANWVRAYVVVLVGHWSDMKYGTGDDHIYFGWVFFGLCMMSIFWMGSKWRELNDGPEPLVNLPQFYSANSNSVGRNVMISVIGLLGFILVFQLPNVLRPNQSRSDLNQVSLALKEYKIVTKEDVAIPGSFKGFRDSLFLKSTDGTEVAVYYFAKQTNGAEMIRGENAFISYEDRAWKIMSESGVVLGAESESGSSSFSARRYNLKSNSEESRELVIFYCIADKCTSSLYFAKGFTALAILLGQGDHSVAIAVSNKGAVQKDSTTKSSEPARAPNDVIVAKATAIASELRKFTASVPVAIKP